MVMEIPFSTQILLYSHWAALLLGEISRAEVCCEHLDMSLLTGIPKELIHCARTAEEPRRVAWHAILQKNWLRFVAAAALGVPKPRGVHAYMLIGCFSVNHLGADSHPSLASV